ncbi:type II toxin-antitoxin system HicB family antitoxin [Desulfobacterales bacterium HSG2]|nr:type II toxin-antitoxin system HicB family antitoxin [Desulfobacterales bacterium HSG2]
MVSDYPVILTYDQNNTIIAQFPDVPEALTVGNDTESVLERAQDALVVALSGYVDEQRDIPGASVPEPGQKTVSLPPPTAMKIGIYQTMRDQKITRDILARQTGADDRQIRLILDMNHNTDIFHLLRALKCLGKEVVTDIRDAA